MDKLQWFVAPIKTEWGEDMMCAGVEIDNDHMFDIYCERSQIEKVEQMLRQLKPEQEPVAYMTYKGYLYHASDPKVLEHSDPTPLYDAPVSKPWVSLTDEKRQDIKGRWVCGEFESFDDCLAVFEAALRSKNNG